MSPRSATRLVALVTTAALALTACANNGDSRGAAGGSGSKELVVATDLPLQGPVASQADSTNKMIQLYLDLIGGKAGEYTVALKIYDNATAAKGAWDDAACAKNATDHVANTEEVAVMGPQNSGCVKIELPILNQDPNGPMLLVAHQASNPGLTKPWETGEPEKFYPTGSRNFARVVATDDYQGVGATAFAAEDLKVKKVYVLDDNQAYGVGVAQAFVNSAKDAGIEIVGRQSWDVKQPNYTALFQAVKASGADLVFLGGLYDNNGGQLVKDKVAVLGPNDGAVKLFAPDGFTGYQDLLALREAEGMYISFLGLTADQLAEKGGAAAELIEAYKVKYGTGPNSNFPLYGVAAMQVILAAIAKSDGTRKSVTEQVFTGEGVTIPSDESILGKDIKIDPATGDTFTRDLTIEIVKDGKETFLKSQSIE